jgi:hypothetical protein
MNVTAGQGAEAKGARRTRRGRGSRGGTGSVIGRAALLTLAWPVVRVLDLFGQWPRALSRLMNRALSRFGPYQPGAHDVLVCSYFKSGTNWTMQIAVQIAHRGAARFEHIHDLVAWPEARRGARGVAVPIEDESTWRDSPTALRVIKTHLHAGQVPYSPQARYICVTRDPKDVFVSSYHFVRDGMLGVLMPPKDKWLRTFLSPDAISGSWAGHVAGWWALRQRDNVLFLTYEEMKRDLPGSVRRIAALMGVALSEAELQSVVQQAGFEHMKSIADRFDLTGRFRGHRAGGRIMRRGQSGGSAEMLARGEQQRIDAWCRAELTRLDCDFPYARLFATPVL